MISACHVVTAQQSVTVVMAVVGMDWSSHRNWWVLPMLDNFLNPIPFEKKCGDKFTMKLMKLNFQEFSLVQISSYSYIYFLMQCPHL